MSSTESKYLVVAPWTPGAEPTARPARTLPGARRMAEELAASGRADLHYYAVRIVRADGTHVAYAGPISDRQAGR